MSGFSGMVSVDVGSLARAKALAESTQLFQLAESPALSRLKSLDLDQLNPRQAQDLLYDLQAAAKRE